MSSAKILQMVLDGQSSIKKDMKSGFKELKKEIVENRRRINRFGHELAELSDDAPTVEEFDELKKDFEAFKHQHISA